MTAAKTKPLRFHSQRVEIRVGPTHEMSGMSADTYKRLVQLQLDGYTLTHLLEIGINEAVLSENENDEAEW